MDSNLRMYKMESSGYLQALRMSGRSKDPKFRSDLGKMCAALKGRVKGRSASDFVGLYELMTETGLSEAFIRNAVDADLFRNVFGNAGVEWAGDHAIHVPHTFGLEEI